MKRSQKRKRGSGWSQTDLQNALDDIKNNRISERAAALKYNIPRRTLKNHIKSGSVVKRLGRKAVFTDTQEKELVERIKKFSNIGMPLTPKIIRKQAYLFCKRNNIKNPFSDKKSTAGKKWLYNFLVLNKDISQRKAQFMNPARAQKLNKHIVDKHFKAIREIYDELNIDQHPERLYNVDEKGCRLTIHRQKKVLAGRGSRRVHLIAQEHAENVTIAPCVNATGNAIPPMIVFKGKRLREEFLENLPAGSLVKMTPKGSMTTELFVEFIEHLAKYKSPGKCLLIFDGASSHLDYKIVDAAEKHDIVLYCLPSNTTHELQPLDKSVNKSFEHFWDEEVLLFIYQNPQKNLTKARFNKIFTRVWAKCMTHSNIINGFRATGLYPWDPSSIPEEAFAPSMLTELTATQLTTKDNSVTAPNFPESVNLFNRTFDSDITFCGEDYSTAQNSGATIKQLQNKLVDYSSSIESLHSVDIHVPIRSSTPGPGPSGLQVQHVQCLPILLSSPSDISDIEYNLPMMQNYPTKRVRIYTSSSDSDEENNNAIQSYFTPKNNQNDSFDDDMPLSELQNNTKQESLLYSSFKEFLPTPNHAQSKKKPRRKALNYVGQKITKDLFKAKSSNSAKNSAKQIKNYKNTTKEVKPSQKVKARKKSSQIIFFPHFAATDPSPSLSYNFRNVKDELYEQPVNFMGPKKSLHAKDESTGSEHTESNTDSWTQFDFSKFDSYLNNYNQESENPDHNRIKRRARTVRKFNTMLGPQLRERPHHYTYPEPVKDRVMEFTTTSRRPGILPDQMNPGVIFRVRMSDAILRIKQRMYEDPERHIEADIIYTNLIKKVVMDEITKFHNLLLMYKTDKSIKEHLGECGGRIYKFISYMTIKVHIYCLFDALWIDGNPYVIGDEYSVTPVEIPPMLQCDAAECNSIVFVDSITEPKDVEE
ncbi:unnamed protein product [Arctia plantaginis]|uniref:HTH CENPB-type domain-containing protein n=2 Tax=cellular organisms TaxID=131567 RepID=A0A8S1BSQ3_ARCPL|nr:unnamed protein product [Arctia plantaginis]